MTKDTSKQSSQPVSVEPVHQEVSEAVERIENRHENFDFSKNISDDSTPDYISQHQNQEFQNENSSSQQESSNETDKRQQLFVSSNLKSPAEINPHRFQNQQFFVGDKRKQNHFKNFFKLAQNQGKIKKHSKEIQEKQQISKFLQQSQNQRSFLPNIDQKFVSRFPPTILRSLPSSERGLMQEQKGNPISGFTELVSARANRPTSLIGQRQINPNL